MPGAPNWDDDEPTAERVYFDDHHRGPRVVPQQHGESRTAGWGADDHHSHAARPRSHPGPRTPAFAGLTVTGAAVVGLAGAGLGAVLDALISPGVGLLYGFVFVLVSAFIGLRLRGQDMWGAVAVPPLVFISAAGIASQVAPLAAGNWVQRTSSDLATAVLGNPVSLLLGTGLAILAVLYRAIVSRRASRAQF